jgi:hypothetical protein
VRHDRATKSQRLLLTKMHSYLTSNTVAYHPALLVGSVGVGKTWLAQHVVENFGSYFNIATDCFVELLKYSSLPKVTPEDVAALVQKYSRQQPTGPVFVDGLDAVLTAIAISQRSGILVNFFSTMRRTRDLPHPTVMIIQLNRHLTENILRQSDWWDRDDCYILGLTLQDRLIIAENWQVMPAVANQARTALEIVLSKSMGGGA